MDQASRSAAPVARASGHAPPAQSSAAGANAPPALALPKGGGAIRGIGEKFAANPVTGTASLTVPIAVSPGRSGFGPQLNLSYDSGAGNGPFGLGWSLSLPSITRKTDKGLPRYDDLKDSDVFILSGAEDLVPAFKRDAAGKLVRDAQGNPVVQDDLVNVVGIAYRVRGFRPRMEGLFARIERWTSADGKTCFWRSISRDNITTWYGRSADSRLADPVDQTRVFSWRICASHDDKGNAIVYEYRQENGFGVDLSPAHEANRSAEARASNWYLKRIKYGNRKPNRDKDWNPTEPAALDDWMFQVVFDYGDGHYAELSSETPDEHCYVSVMATESPGWPVRPDAFSSYRAGFELRHYRRCRRVLMFHNFPELPVQPCLVRSTEFDYDDFDYARNARPAAAEEAGHPGSTRFGSILRSVTQSGYVHVPTNVAALRYLKRSLPPIEFVYSRAQLDETVIDVEDVRNLPEGVDGSRYQWVDLDGEGLSGALTEQAGAWFYKRNVSALPVVGDDGTLIVAARFEPLERLAAIPSAAGLTTGRQQFLDLAADGQVDVVELAGPTPGYYERGDDGDWKPFVPFVSLPNLSWRDPNLRFVDLTGDGHADVLITENEVFAWHVSLGEDGFGARQTTRQASDEEQGPRLVFADGTQSIYLSDMSGDGLTDLVRIRNSEVCYWPNLGYCRWGAKVVMDNAPRFDAPDQFDQKRIRLADIDGSGATDILYLGAHGVDIYRNRCGNSWSERQSLSAFPPIDDLASVTALDLLGNGTACLVWSSPISGAMRHPMRYVDLMGGEKPHLLLQSINNLGAETHVQYAPSTKFYLRDRFAGRPWITKLPFPVHVVERVTTYDRVSGNRFVTRYAYHHGYFDGTEREFRGFGMVEQWDTEEYATLAAEAPETTNLDVASHVPPVLTRTWFHTGVCFGGDRISNFFAGLLDGGDSGEYYREPGLTDAQAKQLLLDDTVLPDAIPLEDELEACRALKGSMLRQEIYVLDATATVDYPFGHPYIVTEQNFTIEPVQPKGGNRHAVFFVHPREALSYHYERKPADPRVSHAMTLEMDKLYGQVRKSLSIGYGRRASTLTDSDKITQERTLVTYTESKYTNPIDDLTADRNNYRAPLPCETRTWEVTGLVPASGARFGFNEFFDNNFRALRTLSEVEYEESADYAKKQRRPIEHVRTLYRPDDLGESRTDDPLSLLALGTSERLALPGETYKLAFTPGLLAKVYQRPHDGQPAEDLLPSRIGVLGGGGPNQGGYVLGDDLKAAQLFPNTDNDGYWWIPSGRVLYPPNASTTASLELAQAQKHFFLPRLFKDTFSNDTLVAYDSHDLLVARTDDAVGNTMQAENDYRVLQPDAVIDPNGNRVEAAFDALGLVVATAVRDGGDELEGIDLDLVQSETEAFMEEPFVHVERLLGNATTRIVYDVQCYRRDLDSGSKPPVYAATLARETHVADLAQDEKPRIQLGFSYSDGFAREIQKKIRAEPGKVPERDAVTGMIRVDADRRPIMIHGSGPRWVGSGWTVFGNKPDQPVRKYEPFFTDTHAFELDEMIGVSPILFYDPVGRVVATLHPNRTWEKVVFDAWLQETWDVNDTVVLDPEVDNELKNHVLQEDGTPRLAKILYSPSWYALRSDAAFAAEAARLWPDANDRAAESSAAQKARAHAGTPTITHLDSLGRAFLAIADNGVDAGGARQLYQTRTELDIEGKPLFITDARGNVVMDYRRNFSANSFVTGYDVAGNQLYQKSADAGERWMLNDATGKPLRRWDRRDHNFEHSYDSLRRPTKIRVIGGDGSSSLDNLCERLVYGEDQPLDREHGLRGRLYEHYDTAGRVRFEEYDFKGNPLRSRRQLARSYSKVPDCNIDPLEDESFLAATEYDVLNRPIQLVGPYSDGAGQRALSLNVTRPGYNEAGLLESLDVWLGLPNEPGKGNLLDSATASAHGVINIDYNAKGQRVQIDHKNGTSTTYTYENDTFRLAHLVTVRTGFVQDRSTVQDLHYTYDPAGNLTQVRDLAQDRIFHSNACVDPSAEYSYDPLYRLIAATGREHNGGGNAQTGADDSSRYASLPNDCQALHNYVETYGYDEVGNILEMKHHDGRLLASPGNVIWKRFYQYRADSNRLLSTSRPGDVAAPSPYGAAAAYGDAYDHDVHGNMILMPHLTGMTWNFRDELRTTTRQAVNPTTPPDIVPETTFYVYDASGQRIRKVTERQNGTRKAERIYMSGFEIYREFDGGGDGIQLERETFHLMDDRRRIALIETRIQGDDGSAKQLVRYQLGNHLGSAVVELNEQEIVITYEEYYPYGSTSYQANNSALNAAGKRYRYTGKERDEECALDYYGARYYAPWIARWTSADPIGIEGGTNLYRMTKNNPIGLVDRDGMQTAGGQNPIFDPNKATLAASRSNGMPCSACHYPDSVQQANAEAGNAMSQFMAHGGGTTMSGGVTIIVGIVMLSGGPVTIAIGAFMIAAGSPVMALGMVQMSGTGQLSEEQHQTINTAGSLLTGMSTPYGIAGAAGAGLAGGDIDDMIHATVYANLAGGVGELGHGIWQTSNYAVLNRALSEAVKEPATGVVTTVLSKEAYTKLLQGEWTTIGPPGGEKFFSPAWQQYGTRAEAITDAALLPSQIGGSAEYINSNELYLLTVELKGEFTWEEINIMPPLTKGENVWSSGGGGYTAGGVPEFTTPSVPAENMIAVEKLK